VSTDSKNPTLVEAGRRGALRRWGPPVRVRLDDFDASERAAILAAIAARRAAKVARERDPEGQS
jgi:hypothetical protein